MSERLTLNQAGLLLTAYCLWLTASPVVHAQSSNGTHTLIQDTFSSAGGQIGGGNPMRAQTILGLPAGGAASNGTFTLIGSPSMGEAPSGPITIKITVTGTVDDPTATISVNGIGAGVSGTTWTAANVPLSLGPNTLTATATDGAGNARSASIKVYLDLPQTKKTPRFSIQVAGTVNDATATVSVNGVAAPVVSGQFSALVPLVNGLNTITASATDHPAGNTGSASIRVFVNPPGPPPAMPTVGTVGAPIPPVTTQSSVTIGGTKTPGTAIWINGAQVVALNDATTWTATITLVEGDNTLLIVTKNAEGTASAPVTITIVVDNLPPVITAASAKTNLNPYIFTGTVDDHLTRVEVNGLLATRSGRTFQVDVPLALGSNTLTITATSPNNYVSTRVVTITLGTIPRIQSAQPADGAKIYTGAATTIQVTATDGEADPIQYQMLLDGAVMQDWSAAASHAWTPAAADGGSHTVTVRVRDGYGGSNDRSVDVLVLRAPIQHP